MDDRLWVAPVAADARGLVLMMHGGAQHGERDVDGRSLALRRTRAMRAAIAPGLRRAGVATAVLRFTAKGWHARAAGGAEPSPVRDARAALADLHTAHPDLPIVLLGHSMGARTGAWAADAPGVVGVVGLAPWFPQDDPVEALAGRHLVAVHGNRDRITSPRHSRRYVERAAEVAASARYVDMGPLGHYMLRGAARWNRVAVTETVGVLDRHVGGVTLPD